MSNLERAAAIADLTDKIRAATETNDPYVDINYLRTKLYTLVKELRYN